MFMFISLFQAKTPEKIILLNPPRVVTVAVECRTIPISQQHFMHRSPEALRGDSEVLGEWGSVLYKPQRRLLEEKAGRKEVGLWVDPLRVPRLTITGRE